ncbi:MAG: peptide chain release factor 2 [bacterium]
MQGGCFDLEGKAKETEELKQEINQPDFWNDQERAVLVTKKLESLESEIRTWKTLSQQVEELSAFAKEASKENDSSLDQEIISKLELLEKDFTNLEFLTLFDQKYDEANAIISLHAGTGGVDAQDWTEILQRMYLRFAEKMNWQAEIIDQTSGNEAGLKSSMIKINGRWAYGYLKAEAGVHRLVRISPFDAEAMRQTSFALLEVTPELPESKEIKIKDEDLKVEFSRSSGPGGQSVNKTSSAVRLVHLPTKISVSCQTQRSQHQNREKALEILKAKLFQLQAEAQAEKKKGIKGDVKKAEWGQQIRSYVLHPYKLVKDHRTNYETSDVDKVLDGELNEFIQAYLKMVKQ